MIHLKETGKIWNSRLYPNQLDHATSVVQTTGGGVIPAPGVDPARGYVGTVTLSP